MTCSICCTTIRNKSNKWSLSLKQHSAHCLQPIGIDLAPWLIGRWLITWVNCNKTAGRIESLGCYMALRYLMLAWTKGVKAWCTWWGCSLCYRLFFFIFYLNGAPARTNVKQCTCCLLLQWDMWKSGAASGGFEVVRWHRAATEGGRHFCPCNPIIFSAFNFFLSFCFTDSTYRHILLVCSSFGFQLVLGLPPPPSIRTFELYGAGRKICVRLTDGREQGQPNQVSQHLRKSTSRGWWKCKISFV